MIVKVDIMGDRISLTCECGLVTNVVQLKASHLPYRWHCDRCNKKMVGGVLGGLNEVFEDGDREEVRNLVEFFREYKP